MIIEKLIKNVYAEFPGFDLVGYSEISIPVFRRKLLCSLVEKKGLAAVDEFVLRYMELEIPIEKCAEIMGLPLELVEQSWFNLLSLELINRESELTEIGKKYLVHFNLESYEDLEIVVSINGLTGDIELDNANLVTSKTLRETGLKAVKPLIETPNFHNIDMRKLRAAFNNLKKMIKKEDKELVALNHVTDDAMKYKRLVVFVFADTDKNTRFMVYEGWQRMYKLESCLIDLENQGSRILKINMGSYYQGHRPKISNELTQSMSDFPVLNLGMIDEEWNKLLKEAKSHVIISLPLIDLCDPSESLINNLLECIKRGVTVEVFVTGREFTNGYQRKQYESILRNKKIPVFNYPYYDSKVLIVDEEISILSDFKKTELELHSTKEAIAEFGYLLKEEELLAKILSRIEQYRKTIKPKYVGNTDSDWFRNKMVKIIELYYQFDDKLKIINNIGWLEDESIPDIQKLLNVGLVSNEMQFKDLLNTMNKSLVEFVEAVWKRNNQKSFFWDGFKNEFPDLQKVMHKIKLYRNYTHHIVLEDKYKPTFYKFIDEDLGGSMPMFVENGYKIIQVKLIEEMEQALIKYCE